MRDLPNRTALSSTLTVLMKAFAFKIGQDGSPDGLVTMYFIHHYSEQIVAVLQLLQVYDDGAAAKSSQFATPNYVQMGVWIEALTQSAGGLPAALFQGVENWDDLAVDLAHDQLSSFAKAIRHGDAYRWLIGQIQKEVTLTTSAWGRAVHGRILEKLPTERVIECPRPRSQCGVFEFPMSLMLLGKSESGRQALRDRAVICECAGNIQVLTMAEYIDLAWPVMGMKFLEFIQTTIEGYVNTAGRDSLSDPGGGKIDDTGSARVYSSGAETASRSPSTDDSSSLDPEMLSIPSGSGTIDSGEGGSKLGVQVFRAVFARLIQQAIHIQEVEYDQRVADSEGPSQDADGAQRRQNQTSNSTSTSSSTTTVKRPGKRKAQDINQGSGDREDDGNDESPKPARPNKLPPSPLGPRYLACPFWKLDSAAHFECPLFQLDTISHVKQHLARKHTPAHYCQRCYAQFGSDNLLDIHINGTFCSRTAGARLAGISYDQRRRLSMKSAKAPEVQQWHAIWDILFTGVEHPACVYVYPKQLVELRTMRRFSLQEGPEILTQELQARGMALRSDVGVGEQQLQEALLSGLTIIFDRFLQRPPGDVEDDEAPTALGLCNAPRSTASSSDLPPLESRADGGLGLGLSSNVSGLFPPTEQPRIFPNRLPGVGDDPPNPSVPGSNSRFEGSRDVEDGPRAPWSPGHAEEAGNANLATNDILCFSEFSDDGGMPHWDPSGWQANQTLEDILGTIAVTSQEGLLVSGSDLEVSDIPGPDAPP
ncbi:hypothetical protein B0T16DRAFT_493707 [Cercophora newfieldiana]|uniref:Uncharacterized protein n=1 Tax=Cercophora newfieldiana TaxID=92897 RepID=A0AA39Y8E4_9PEZI|nr:hypothetical protein B0T16DRAFT_493707 [Cercophora newfieldiana]